MLEPVLNNPWIRALGVLLGIVFFVIAVYVLSPILIPLFLAFILAYLLDPVVDFFERRKIPRMRTIAGMASLGLLLLLVVPPLLVASIISEANQLVVEAGDWARSTDGGWFRQQLSRLPFDEIATAMEWEVGENEDALAVVARESAEYVRDNAFSFITAQNATLAEVGEYTRLTLTGVLRFIADTFVGFILFLSNLALFGFVFVYLLRDFDRIVASARDMLPRRYEPKVSDIMRQIHQQIQNFIQGTGMVGLCLGGMYALGFLICGVPFAIPIAIFGAFAAFVPFAGVAITSLLAIGFTLFEHQISWHIVGVLITLATAQILEGNVLTPNIVGEKVGLGPVWVILAVMVFGTYFGFVGILIAVPLAACLKVLVMEVMKVYTASSFFTEEALEGPSESRDAASSE